MFKVIALLVFLAASTCHGLLAASSSACSSLCIDNPTFDAKSANSFTTGVVDLTCSDTAYNMTKTGEKFEACMSCLQNSTSISFEYTDQQAFLHNLRSTMSTCLFSEANNTSTTTPRKCQLDSACGPLKGALQTGTLDALSYTKYEYCDAGLETEAVVACVQCLQDSEDQKFMGNFMIALEAGCQQKPAAGNTISLSGSLFTSEQITIGTPATKQDTRPRVLLSISAIICIISAGLLLLLTTLAIILFVHCRHRRQRQRKRLNDLKSQYDARFGADNISYPNAGGYAEKSNNSSTESLPRYTPRSSNTSYSAQTHAQTIDLPLRTPLPVAAPLGDSKPALPSKLGPVHPAYLPQLSNMGRLTIGMVTPPLPCARLEDSRASLSMWSESEEGTPGLPTTTWMRLGKAKMKVRTLSPIAVLPRR